jgi:hypothetical protein
MEKNIRKRFLRVAKSYDMGSPALLLGFSPYRKENTILGHHKDQWVNADNSCAQ